MKKYQFSIQIILLNNFWHILLSARRCSVGRESRGKQKDEPPPLKEAWLPAQTDTAKQQPVETNLWENLTQGWKVLWKSVQEGQTNTRMTKGITDKWKLS